MATRACTVTGFICDRVHLLRLSDPATHHWLLVSLLSDYVVTIKLCPVTHWQAMSPIESSK